MASGNDILAESKAAAEASANRMNSTRAPRRFWLANNPKKGKVECEVIILNESMESAVALYEHEIYLAQQKQVIYRASPIKFETDPLVKILGKEPYYITYITVATLEPWTDKEGKQHEYSRELLGIKSGQIDRFWQIAAASIKKNGTLRGTVLHMKRNLADSKSPKIGEPQIMEDTGSMFDFIPEDELIEDYGHAAVKSKKGDVIYEENELLRAFTPEEIYAERPSAAALEAEFGDGSVASDNGDDFGKSGGTRRARRSIEDTTDDADGAEDLDEDDIPF